MNYSKNQSLDLSLTVTFDNGLSLAVALTHVIECRFPNGTIVTWPATVNGTALEVEIAEDILSVIGIYAFWPKLTFTDDYLYYGTASNFGVVEAWDNV